MAYVLDTASTYIFDTDGYLIGDPDALIRALLPAEFRFGGEGVAAYVQQVQKLLPPGAAYPRHGEARWTALVTAIARILERVDARTLRLIVEADPRTTVSMVDAWETALGLPDPCSGARETLQERRSAILARLTSRGGSSREFFVNLAAALGFTISIEEVRFFRAGTSRMGDRVNNADDVHSWIVHVGQGVVIFFRTGASRMGERLGTIVGAAVLECAIRRAAPAHTLVLFDYYVEGS